MPSVPQQPTSPERTALYRFYDNTSLLLYVGVTSDPDRRWSQHEETKEWWPQVASKTVEWCASRPEALDKERIAIRIEKPLYNHQNSVSPILAQIEPQRLNEVPNGTWRPYEFMANELRGFVQQGCLRPGDRFPVVRELVDVYGVSSVTVQRALGVLKRQGFAVGRAGFGICAALPPGFRHETANAPVPEGVIEQLANHLEAPAPRTCEALKVPPGTVLGGKSWVRRVDGQAVEIVHFYRHPGAQPGDRVHGTTEKVTADPPTSDAVAILGLAPLLTVRRVTYSEDGRPLDFYEISKNGHLLSVRYEF